MRPGEAYALRWLDLDLEDGAARIARSWDHRGQLFVEPKTQAGVRSLDMYSLRHTFATLARTAGEGAFNVSRQLGHSKSQLVDAVYAHSLASGLAAMSERVTARAFGTTPQFRLIDGGRGVREPLESTENEDEEKSATG